LLPKVESHFTRKQGLLSIQKNPADRWQRNSFPRVSFISKFSVLSEFIEHLPTAADLAVQAVEKPQKTPKFGK